MKLYHLYSPLWSKNSNSSFENTFISGEKNLEKELTETQVLSYGRKGPQICTQSWFKEIRKKSMVLPSPFRTPCLIKTSPAIITLTYQLSALPCYVTLPTVK